MALLKYTGVGIRGIAAAVPKNIINNYELYVYPRISEGKASHHLLEHKNVQKINAPIVQISSTFIRKAIKDKKDISTMLPQDVWKYIDEMNFYK